MVVKSKQVSEHLSDLEDVFSILKKYKLHLNVSKCSLCVSLGKFLVYAITYRGIEVNLDQIKIIHDFQPHRNPKEVKRLTGDDRSLE